LPDVKISPASIVIALAMILILGAFGWLTFGPKPPPPPPPVLTPEAKQYLNNLALSNVRMQAAESMVNQRVVEILGDIANKGDRTVKLAEVTCVFRDYNGTEIKRERVPIVGSPVAGTTAGSLAPGASRAFRLAFDDVPPEWNQVMPALVIAQIQFDQAR
jgi:hypothetical protein